MSTRNKRLESAYENLNGQERKVYAAVPLATAWTIPEIQSELGRTQHTAPDYRVTERCLQALKERGLIRRIDSRYTREGLADYSVPVLIRPAQEAHRATPVQKVVEASPSPLEALYRHASGLRSTIKGLERLAQDIEAAVLEVEDLLQTKDQQSEKLGQLKRLLSELSGDK